MTESDSQKQVENILYGSSIEPVHCSECLSVDTNINDISTLICDIYPNLGFQATNLGLASEIIKKMYTWSLNEEVVPSDEEEEYIYESTRKKVKTRIFLSFTSNIISSGLRSYITMMAKNKLAHIFVTSGGGIEEDILKCLSVKSRLNGWNRIGNLIVPNTGYCLLEDFVIKVLDEAHQNQINNSITLTPSKLCFLLGAALQSHPRCEESFLFWAWKNSIPVFCPGISDGAIGDIMYFRNFKKPGLIVDILQDVYLINEQARTARKTGAIIIGGGIAKHHVMNANLMRNGLDFAVYLTSASPFDGSDSGGSIEEARSWGKLKATAPAVKCCSDATLTFPLLYHGVIKTFSASSISENWIYDKDFTKNELNQLNKDLIKACKEA